VTGVQFLLDGVNLGAEVVTAPYSVNWNTTGGLNGSHTLQARARDGSGNTANVNCSARHSEQCSRYATAHGFNNCPTNGANVSGPITVSANVADNVGVSGVQFCSTA